MSSAASTRRSKPGSSRILRGDGNRGTQRRLIGRMLFVSRDLVWKPNGTGGKELVASPHGQSARLVFEPSNQQYGYVSEARYQQVQREMKE